MPIADLSSEAEFDCDVAVLGAGAAGLVAGIRAAECGARVVVLEKNRRAGVKILMSGGTRCNITNARGLRRLEVGLRADRPGVQSRVVPRHPGHPGGVRARRRVPRPGARGSFDVDQTVRLFEAEGVATKIEGNGKIFPVSDRAVDVLEALLRRLDRIGADLPRPEPRPVDRATRGSAECGFGFAVAAARSIAHGAAGDPGGRRPSPTRAAARRATAMRSRGGSGTRSSSPALPWCRSGSSPSGSPSLRGPEPPRRGRLGPRRRLASRSSSGARRSSSPTSA